jgi:magnesium chelatase family protein
MEEHSGFAHVLAAQPIGSGAELVTVEADVSRGLHSFSIVGLPDKAMEEARDRIGAAIRHSGCKSPKATNRRIILSLSPASLRKDGAHYDVPLALCYLAAADEIHLPKEPVLFAGELALDGSIRGVRGILPQVITARAHGIRVVFVPATNAAEATLVGDVTVFAANTLRELMDHLLGIHILMPCVRSTRVVSGPPLVDLMEIRNVLSRSLRQGDIILCCMDHPVQGKQCLHGRYLEFFRH